MGKCKRLVLLFVLLVTLAPAMSAAQPREAPDEFLPVSDDDLQAEQIPAAPLVFSAYSFVWIVFGVYVFSVWRRVNAVEGELRSVLSRIEKDGQ